MLKKMKLALLLTLVLPGFATTAYACGSGCGDGSSCAMGGDGCEMATAAAPAALAKPQATAARPTRSYRSYSYVPNYGGGYRGYRGGFSSGVRGAASKANGR